MANYRVHHSASFDQTHRDWEVDLRYDDGGVFRARFADLNEEQLVNSCKGLLDADNHIECMFVWSEDRWWGSISRNQSIDFLIKECSMNDTVYLVIADEISLDDESWSPVLACKKAFATYEAAEKYVIAAETWCNYFTILPVKVVK